MSQGRGTPLRVAMIGHAFMGAAHSQAWRSAPRFFDLPRDVVMAVVCGTDVGRTVAAAERPDWREVAPREDVDIVDICPPGDTHAEIALAALSAGKHVLCEKPLANTVDEARGVAEAAAKGQSSGGRSMVGLHY